ncbi:hypothetical protein V5P93_000572 [Actinokineospora auranticolor]|uniref:Uncharacterized protein n=1 Tax=Actinokineospora auranticolor TaxID=155976 RepID=A0A2S6GZB1_9PSEU|nr:hypothetical protein [Actinokineospora auranticolor]PPK70548.1 hypothetical protein CLV40_102463 [Actinokineospora auranticolor]
MTLPLPIPEQKSTQDAMARVRQAIIEARRAAYEFEHYHSEDMFIHRAEPIISALNS